MSKSTEYILEKTYWLEYNRQHLVLVNKFIWMKCSNFQLEKKIKKIFNNKLPHRDCLCSYLLTVGNRYNMINNALKHNIPSFLCMTVQIIGIVLKWSKVSNLVPILSQTCSIANRSCERSGHVNTWTWASFTQEKLKVIYYQNIHPQIITPRLRAVWLSTLAVNSDVPDRKVSPSFIL